MQSVNQVSINCLISFDCNSLNSENSMNKNESEIAENFRVF